MMFDSNTDTIPKDSTKVKISIAWKILRMLIVEDFGFYNFIALIRSDWCWNFFIFDSDFRFEEGENGTCSQVNRVSAWADSSVNIRPRPFLVSRLWGETKLFCVFAIKSWHESLILMRCWLSIANFKVKGSQISHSEGHSATAHKRELNWKHFTLTFPPSL